MAKFLTITQKGYTFTVHDADKLVRDEEWNIERVSAFMSIHHTLNVMATKYAKGITYRPAIACIMYTLNCDPDTSQDLDKLNSYLIGKLCGMYENPDQQRLLGRQLSDVLDEIEVMALDYIKAKEAPIEVFGKQVSPGPFFSRPSKLEYDTLLEREQAQEQRYWDRLDELVKAGTAHGHKILIRDGSNTYTGIITATSAKCIYCDVKDEYGRLIQSGARFPKDSKRFIIESLS